jgi:hypothetical protein
MRLPRWFSGSGSAPGWSLILAFALIATAVWLLKNQFRTSEPAGTADPVQPVMTNRTGPARSSAEATAKPDETASSPRDPKAEWSDFFDETADRFASARTTEQRVLIYAGLRDRLLASPDPLAAAEAIAAFLAGGRDVETGLPFLVGNDGFLDTAPTMRTALLDFVADLDAETALRLARGILDARTTPDEYAVALRNLAWSPLVGAEREEELTRRFGALLDEKSWLAQPSTGFLEAFDAAVALSNQSAIRNLASVAGLEDTSGNPVRNGVNEAATLALDRIMLRTPDEVVALFAEDPAFLAHRPGQRATLLARLDLRRENQFEQFRRYLGSGSQAPDELDYFASLFPNTAYSYGHRLISRQEPTPSIAEMQETDRAFLRLLTEARDAGTLPEIPAVRTILTNLQSYVDEAAAAARLPVDTAPALGETETPSPAVPRNPGRSGAPGRARLIP